MFWQITTFPLCQHHVFLSHCAGDREWLVRPVADRLKQQQIIPWLDQEDYYYGRNSRTALRDGLLRSRHVVFFVTLAMMDYRRGWCPMELAYADLIQANLLQAGGPLVNLMLPLFFLQRNDAELTRTVWNEPRDRGEFHSAADGDPVDWAVCRIGDFLRREQDLALDMSKLFRRGPQRAALNERAGGLVQRVTAFDPGPIP